MAEFINTADIIGDDEMCDQIIMRTVTEYKENRISTVGQYAFYGCKSLETVVLPNVTNIKQYAFASCKGSVLNVSCPNAMLLESCQFRDASSLISIDLLGFEGSSWDAFLNCTSLKTLILRRESLCAMSGTNMIGSTPIAKGTGYVYVPRSLVDSYKAATNWSAYAAQIRAIEDYTNDGTVTGSFNWCTGVELDKTSLTFDDWKTQTLMATMLTPSPHGFDVVEWSSADESIAAVNNGVVTPMSKGTTTITASCNGYSATCEVVVTMEGLPMLYQLAEPKTFNGSSDYIDTGVQLFDTAQDFTIICEAEFSKLTDQNKCLFHCINEFSPWPGLSIDGSNGVRICYTGSSSLTTTISDRTAVSTLAIRYVDGKMDAIRYRNTSGEIVTQAVSGTPTYTKVTQNLLLGAYQDTSGTKGRFFNGTVSRFDVYSIALSDEQIEVLL